MKVVTILSGGMDSATLLHDLVSQYEVYALSFDYGQKHVKEIECAKNLCAELGVQHKVINLTSITQLLGGSSLTDDIEVPKGHYADENMKKTVVPNRNMIMLSIATAWAVSLEAEKVFFGAHAGDHAIYPDCRQEFVIAMSEVTKIANYHPVEIVAPYLQLDKGDIAIIGTKLNVPYEKTWTCYVGAEKHCGACGACVERKEAMEKAGVIEPEDFYG